jgi:hypothetical protein
MMYIGGILNHGIMLFSLDYLGFQIQNEIAVLYQVNVELEKAWVLELLSSFMLRFTLSCDQAVLSSAHSRLKLAYP